MFQKIFVVDGGEAGAKDLQSNKRDSRVEFEMESALGRYLLRRRAEG